MEVGCMIFGMNHKTKPKNMREITIYKATWWFGGISNRHTSWGIFGRNILST